MSRCFTLFCGVIALMFLAVPAEAGVSAGVVVWSHNTDLDVDSAMDFDGSDRTIDEKAKEWDMSGSSMLGLRVIYDLPKLVSVYGELGTAQTTVRDEDVTDPDRDLTSLGFDDGLYFAIGTQVGADFGNKAFWSAGVRYSSFSTDFAEDVDVTFDYDETVTTLDGKVGYKMFCSGLRFVKYDGELSENDVTELPGLTQRRTDLVRDGQTDLLLGVQTKGERINAFAEVSFIGTTSGIAGLSVRF